MDRPPGTRSLGEIPDDEFQRLFGRSKEDFEIGFNKAKEALKGGREAVLAFLTESSIEDVQRVSGNPDINTMS